MFFEKLLYNTQYRGRHSKEEIILSESDSDISGSIKNDLSLIDEEKDIEPQRRLFTVCDMNVSLPFVRRV